MATTTFSITSGDDDAMATREGTNWSTISAGTFTGADTGTDLYASHDGFTTYFYANCALLRFDTSALGASVTVTGATLKLYVIGAVNPGGRTLEVFWYDYGGTPVASADWNLTSSNGDAATGVAFGSFTTSAVNDIALTAVHNVNTTGYTGLQLALKDTGSPVANIDNLRIASYEHASQEAQLEVTYTEGSATTKHFTLLGIG